MGREIRFRARMKEPMMHEGFFAYSGIGGQWSSRNGFYYGSIDWNTIGQYTGLHDKNGKEIYEGDIVEKHDHNALGYGRTRICEIAWDEKFLWWSIRTTFGDWYSLGEYDSEQLEVIGNIYENPELLKGQG